MTGNQFAVHVEGLQKIFKVPERESGLRAAARGLIKRKHREVRAVDQISFNLDQGEIVGFLGPNGAGKTTTLKMLSGLLYPTGGTAAVLGYEPSKREKDFLRQITLVMGQRNQLSWDIPALDSYELHRSIYEIPHTQYQDTLDEMIDLLDLGELINKPVRNLSLGERMKVEIAGSLLHLPKVLFLDEPTIGLDVTMQRRIRSFVAEYNSRHGATVLLTSHYMADVVALCKRVIVIHHGVLLYDGVLSGLIDKFSAEKTIALSLADRNVDLQAYGKVASRDGDRAVLQVPKGQVAEVTTRLLADLQVIDLTIEDPPIEDVIEHVFTDQSLDRSSHPLDE